MPTCHVELVMRERHGVELDYPKRRGIWLDRREPDKIVEKAVAAQPADLLAIVD